MKISEKFNSQEELYQKLKYWKEVLNLNDWIIKASLVDEIQNESYCDGVAYVNLVMKTSNIKIRKFNKEDANSLLRYCEEAILIHELLHCVLDKNENEDVQEHVLLEFLSRSFVIAKYNLPLNYFDNTNQHEDDF